MDSITDFHNGIIDFNAQVIFSARKRILAIQAFKALVNLYVDTPGGVTLVEPGDIVVKDERGRLEVYGADEFQRTFEVINGQTKV